MEHFLMILMFLGQLNCCCRLKKQLMLELDVFLSCLIFNRISLHLLLVTSLFVWLNFPPLCDSVDPTRLLLTFNVSVNLGDKYHKNTALHWAVLAGNTTVISLLLDANANVDAQNIKVAAQTTVSVHPYGPICSVHSDFWGWWICKEHSCAVCF